MFVVLSCITLKLLRPLGQKEGSLEARAIFALAQRTHCRAPRAQCPEPKGGRVLCMQRDIRRGDFGSGESDEAHV
jgi:hypothetical protein